MRALVTGATGFIGAHVTRTLLREGWAVRALVRPGSRSVRLEGLEVERFPGDVCNPDAVRRAVQGCEAVFHVAALYAFGGPEEAFYRVNVLGTRNVLRAALAAGVERAVYTSSVATVAPPPPGGLSDEETPPASLGIAGPYKRSKVRAEREALRLFREGLPVVIVNPTAPVGPGDHKPTPTGRMVLDFLRGRMFAYLETGLNLAAVEDVAEGHLLALERGRPGERYILGSRNLKLIEIFRLLAEITGRPAPRLKLPYFVALGGAYLSEGVARLRRRPPHVALEAVRTAKRPLYVRCDKAVRELGLAQSPIEGALERAARWFTDHGYLERSRVPRALGGELHAP